MPKAFKKRLALFLSILLSLALVSGVVVAAGSADDPLITRAYLQNEILVSLTEAIHGRTVASGESDTASVAQIKAVADNAEAKLSLDALAQLAADKLWASAGANSSYTVPAVNHLRELTLTPGSVLTAQPGCVVLVRSGRVQTRNGVGATVVRIPAARELYNQWELSAGDYLIVTEKAPIGFTPVLGSATVMISGEFMVEHGDPYEPEYTDLADALNKMGLFLGTGNGYELDRVSRRDEGLIMMLRLLGDEQAALALTEKLHPFSDVRPWASAYVSYAYKNGLTNGTSSYEYSSMMLIEPEQYMTFLLRALGYTDSGDNPDFHYKNAISAAVSFGIISQNEAQMLTSTPLYRDKLAYISYYGLFAHMKGTSTRLLDYLIEKGAVDYNTAQLAILSVTRTRP